MDASWYWKRIVKIKDKFKGKMDLHSFVNIEYSIHKGCEILIGRHQQRQNWSEGVWNRIVKPKHRFLIWLATLNKLKTRERLWNLSLISDKVCLICGVENESCKHLFFQCIYSERCLRAIKEWLNIRTDKRELTEL